MAKKSEIQGFFVFLHGKFANCKRAHKELMTWLQMMSFNLHVHSCKHRHKCDTQLIAFMLDPAKSHTTKGKLYRLNNVTADKQEKWPHTGHWKFVPFAAKGNITDAHIANMFQ
eukprot:1182301-Ditylum_brightwellii.AAC.1